MNKENKSERDLILYWYYTITMLAPPKNIDNQDIKKGINILKTSYINKYKIRIRDWNNLKKGQVFAAVKLRLKVPQKHYYVELKNALEKSIEINKKNNDMPELGDYLSSKSTVSEIASRYEELILDSDHHAGVWTNIELEEYNTLIRLMIPDDHSQIFFALCKKLNEEIMVIPNTNETEKANMVDRDIVLLNNQLSVAHDVGKKQGKELLQLRNKTKYSLRHLSDEQLKEILYETKKQNGKPNYTKMGEYFGYHRTTIKSEIDRRNIIS